MSKKKNKIDPLGIKNVCFSHCKSVSKKDKRQKQWKKQRLTRGFDNTELWNLDTTICSFIYPRLIEFRKNTCGYPPSFTKLKTWKRVLDKMIYSLKTVVVDDQFTPRSVKDNRDIDIGFALLKKYFWNLWN